MTFIDPRLKPQFDSLSKELQEVILSKDVQIHSLQDLIQCLETIVNE
ncbi:hypothetical protein [Acetivibrio sp. MSJd-27]|jgi:hypothetical protein|nr:hypothetical protein [Acetivibrio sp. MSJd-27]MBU5449193.1 hypothetical protein [Acetivibrio sp. MSJd-27]